MKKELKQHHTPSGWQFIVTAILAVLVLIPVLLCAQNPSKSRHTSKSISKTKYQAQKTDTLCVLLRCKSADKSDAWIDKAMLEKQDSAQIATLIWIQAEIDRKKALAEAKKRPKRKGVEEMIGTVEEAPSFPEGDVPEYIKKHLIYPPKALKDKVQGRVIVQFWVNKDGSIGEVKVARGLTPELDDEAVRVVESMPKWKPAKQRNQPVRVKYTLPVNFILPK